jgi:DNA-binding PadR family transcriptional regulator
MNSEVLNENQSKEKSTLASIVKRPNAMKILKYISENTAGFESYYHKELADALKMNESTTYKNLNRLVEVGLLDKTARARKEKYYSVLDKNLAEKAIEKYKRWVGFCLSRLVPYERQYVSQLKQNKRFIEACKYYGFSISEGLSVVLGCYKVGKVQDGTEIIVWRNEQGFDYSEE